MREKMHPRIGAFVSAALITLSIATLGAGVSYADEQGSAATTQEYTAAQMALETASTTNETGGAITTSTSASAIKSAFGGGDAVSVALDESAGKKTLTITMKADVRLKKPIAFQRAKGASAGDKIILNLNGKKLIGAAGAKSTKERAAKGQNAIQIAAADFDVEIVGPGSVIGGKGSVRTDAYGLRSGQPGGCAVFFTPRADKNYDPSTGTDLDYNPDSLEYGLTVSGGAVLSGGAGGDVSYDDWRNSVAKGGIDSSVTAGEGGTGIDQVYDSNLDDGYNGESMSEVLVNRSYARIIIANGKVSGGAGGNVLTDDHPFTYAELAKVPAIQAEIKRLSGGEPYSNAIHPRLLSADGGCGIRFYSGRKYIEVGKNATVQGGVGGQINYGPNGSMVNRIAIQGGNGDGGNGIEVCGDMGLTNDYPETSAAASGANCVGIRVYGTVRGGCTSNVAALYDNAGNAGKGILIYYYNWSHHDSYVYDRYDVYGSSGYVGLAPFDTAWGTIVVESSGSVLGGDGGSAPCGTAGSGGAGIAEESDSWAMKRLPYLVVNGRVKGGDGGNSGSIDVTTAGTVPLYSCGSGGNGLDMAIEGSVVMGNGTIAAGDCGDVTERGDFSLGMYDRDHYEGVKKDSKGRLVYGGQTSRSSATYKVEKSNINNRIKLVDGGYAMVRSSKANGLKATVTMTSFKLGSGPTTDTELNCTYAVPSGYAGKVYVRWCAKFGTLQVEPSEFDYDKDYANAKKIVYDSTTEFANGEFDLEGMGTDYKKFMLLGNKSYPNSKQNEYFYRVEKATVERIAERAKFNDKNPTYIYCYVMLDDGRYVKSNMIWFTKTMKSAKGWVKKSANPLSVEGKTATVKYSKLKNKNQTLRAANVIKFVKAGQGALTYAKVSGNKGITINKKIGKVTVNKGLKKGTYKVKATVKAAGNNKYKASLAKNVTFKVKVV